MKPAKWGRGDTNGRESIEKDSVRNGVKGCTQVKKNENSDEARVSCSEEVIGDF